MTIKSIGKVLLGVVIIIGLYMLLQYEPEITHGPGMMAPEEPIQKRLKGTTYKNYKGFSIQLLAEFDITAQVLSREDYWLGKEAEISPMDLALGWGIMSDESIMEKMDISQSGRWYKYKVNDAPISVSNVGRFSSNMHLIPSTEEIEERLDDVIKGNIVNIKGYLVKAFTADGWHWKSSLSRTDTGGGACEIIFIEEFRILK